jgi:tetratricopeptide (TPR) repeat protein
MEEEELYNKARAALDEGKPEEVLSLLNTSNAYKSAGIYFLKGEASYHLQQWGSALNYFRKVLELAPEDSKAKAYIEMIQNILSFYHTDFFNP